VEEPVHGSVITRMSYGNRNRSSGYGGRSGGYGGGSRGFGGSSYNSGPKPVEVGKEYDVEITELSRRGDGVAKISNFVIFVKGSKVGQKTKIKIESVGPRFAIANVVGTTAVTEEKSEAPNADDSVTESV
jgi:predicted RNA-binding protein with TRAM domain